MADREGFEPSLPLTVNTLSKRARSTTLPSVLIARSGARSKEDFWRFGNSFCRLFAFFLTARSIDAARARAMVGLWQFVHHCDKVARHFVAMRRLASRKAWGIH